MSIAGLKNTADFDTPNGRRPQNWREAMLMLYPNGGGTQRAPLAALTAVMKSEATDDPVFHWFTKTMQDRRLMLSATLSGTPVAGDADTITVNSSYSSAQQLVAGDLLYAEHTGEILQVTDTPVNGTTVKVTRGVTFAIGADLHPVTYNGAGFNPFIKIIGQAYEEGSLAPDPIAFDPQEIFNQTQIFRGTYGITGTAAATKTRTSPNGEENELRRERMEIFSSDMEMAFWFGQKSTRMKNGKPLRTTQGVLGQIPTSRRFAPTNGELTYDQLEAWSVDMFRYGNTEKLGFCGGTFLNAVSKMVRKNGTAQFNIDQKVTQYGIGGITRLNFPNGSLLLKPHPLFTQMVGGTNSGTPFTSMDNAACILDMGNLKYRYLKGRDVQFQKDLAAIGEDANRAGWIGECGLEVHHPYTHTLITGVTSGAADAA